PHPSLFLHPPPSHPFFSTPPPPPPLYTLSLHDALPISASRHHFPWCGVTPAPAGPRRERASDASTPNPITAPSLRAAEPTRRIRSEEHTSELQSRFDLVCRLLLEKKKKI